MGLIILAALALAGTQSPISETERAAVVAAVRAQLKDPDSAKFRGIKRQNAGKDDGYYCGWVNAKNGYGGYTGFAIFYASPDGAQVLPADLSDPSLC